MAEVEHEDESHDLEPPMKFCCPITHELMRDPVTTICGHTFERGAIEEWFRGHSTCPYDNNRLGSQHLSPNFALKQSIASFVKKRPLLTIQNQIRTDFQLAVQLREKSFERQQLKPPQSSSSPLSSSSSSSSSSSCSSVASINQFLDSLSLSKYASAFEEEGAASIEDLALLSEDELRDDIGLKRLEARRLLNALQSNTDKSKQSGRTAERGKEERKEEVPSLPSLPDWFKLVLDGQRQGITSTKKLTKDLSDAQWKQAVGFCSGAEGPELQGFLGYCYYYGGGVAEDKEEAERWFRKAAEQGNASAQNSLGICYDNGEGVAEDKEEAERWFRKAAVQGDASAQINLGYCYNNGEGVAEDKEEAVRWYRKAAEQGNASAQTNLGYCYNNGKGVSEDKEEAVRWYRKAAEQGNSSAQLNLGYCYNSGEGVAEDKEEAVRWYRKAAEQGNSSAQFNLRLLLQ